MSIVDALWLDSRQWRFAARIWADQRSAVYNLRRRIPESRARKRNRLSRQDFGQRLWGCQPVIPIQKTTLSGFQSISAYRVACALQRLGQYRRVELGCRAAVSIGGQSLNYSEVRVQISSRTGKI